MTRPQKEEFLPIDIIFSCNVCLSTFSEIYKIPESDKGFRDDGNPEEHKQVTKFWLTKCGHLSCAKHFEGGGIPFHRAGEQPSAACPICVSEKNDTQNKALFAIRGSQDGQHDPNIPKHWFDAPPINLDGNEKGMDALRFHYLSLVRFGTRVLANLRHVEASADELGKLASSRSEENKKLNSQIESLQSRVLELEQCERELRPWKAREPKIKHYLGLFTQITRENEKLREQLAFLGYAVPSRNYILSPERQPAQSTRWNSSENEKGLEGGQLQQSNWPHKLATTYVPGTSQTDSDRTYSGPFVTNLDSHQSPVGEMLTTGKRKRDGKALQQPNESQQVPPQLVRENSSNLMPPPPLPLTWAGQSRCGNEPVTSCEAPQRFQALDVGLASSSYDRSSKIFDNNSQTEHGDAYVLSPHNPWDGMYNNWASNRRISNLERKENVTQQTRTPSQNGLLDSTPQANRVDFNDRFTALKKPHPGIDFNNFYHNVSSYPNEHMPTSQTRSQTYNSRLSLPDPKTPLPTKQSFPAYGSESVASPFFSVRSNQPRADRITLPQKSTIGYPLNTRHIEPKASRATPRRISRTGLATAASVVYPESRTHHSHIKPHDRSLRNQLLVSTPRYGNESDYRNPAATADSQKLAPPSSPYFTRVNGLEPFSLSSNGHEPHKTPQMRFSTGQTKVLLSNPEPFLSARQAAPHSNLVWRNSNDEYVERVGTSTGLKSGASRLSREWAREASARPSRNDDRRLGFDGLAHRDNVYSTSGKRGYGFKSVRR